MSPFEELYGESCNTPTIWSDQVNMVLIGPNIQAEMEQEIQVIKNNLKETHDMKKHYMDQHRLFKEFQVGEHVYL